MKDLMDAKLFLKNKYVLLPVQCIITVTEVISCCHIKVNLPTNVLGPPLLITEMSKLNKHHISGREFLKNNYFVAS